MRCSLGRGTSIQRFGSEAKLNIHLHGLVLDGVYGYDADGAPRFIEASAPTNDERHALVQTVIARLAKLFMRRGVLSEEIGQTDLASWTPTARRRARFGRGMRRPSSTASPSARGLGWRC